MAWTEQDLVTIGFAPIRPPRRGASFAPHLERLCTTGMCSVGGWPDDAHEHAQRWNVHGYYDAPDVAMATVPAAARTSDEPFLGFAVRALPVRIDGASDLPWPLREAPAAIPASWVRLGFDVVCVHDDCPPDCSPLACSGAAARMPCNRWCLFDSLDAALTAARRFRHDAVEPGPYGIFEVWAERLPAP